MQYRPLGNTDLRVSVVTMGCWGIAGGSNWGEQDPNLTKPIVDAALDLGVNTFDTAPAYGNAEEMLGHALGSRRKDAVIATKLAGDSLQPGRVEAACDASLKALRTTYIDLYQIHWPNHAVPVADTLGALTRLVEKGKVRALGVSNFGPLDLADALPHAAIASNQLSYSLIFRAIEFDITPLCVKHNLGILCYSPLMQGLLSGKFRNVDEVPLGRARTRHFNRTRTPEIRHGESGCEAETFAAIDAIRSVCEELNRPMSHVALAWCLHRPAVAAVLAGVRTPEQMRENAEASELKLSPGILARLDAATQTVKQRIGRNADLWANPAQPRMR